jgi:hypothetical protein
MKEITTNSEDTKMEMDDSSDDFFDLPDEIQEAIRDINNNIVGCANCQPYDSEDKDIVWVTGHRHEISDVLYDHDISEEYLEKILPHIECPSCGNVFEYLSDDVGIMSEYEIKFQEKYDAIVEIEKDKIQAFYNFLSKYPYLGSEHEVGQEIAKEIKIMPLETINNKIYYRARKPENGKIFRHRDMYKPPQNKNIPEGRFNHYGQSHLYLGETEELCAMEKANEKKELLWMQKYKIIKLERILDVSEYISPYNIDEIPLFFAGLFYSGLINVQKSNNISWTPEYFIPRFIADVARHNEINGIIYQSTKTIGRNLVIFDLSKCTYEFEGEPYTFVFDRKQNKETFETLF